MIKSRCLSILLIVLFGLIFSLSAQSIPDSYLSGQINITLKDGLWKSSNQEISYQDLNLDILCHNNDCDSEIWGFAPEFNQGEHSGKVIINRSNNTWNLQVNLTINRDPWLSLTGEATYQIELQKTQQNQLIGYYQGKFKDRLLKGQAIAKISPLYPQPLTYHKPIQSQEHPRLIFRPNLLPELRKKSQTKTGKIILDKLKKTLDQPVTYDGYVPNAGYHAAGQCFLSLINQNPQQAKDAWQFVKTAINQSYPRLFEESPLVAGIAIAYDFCYPYWPEQNRQIVTNWLGQKATIFIEGTPDKGWNPTAWSNWNARVRGAAGLASLAILNEPENYFSQEINVRRLLTIAERNIIRYLETAIGDHGFGSEGDHYTTEPWVLTLLPFFEAARQVEGKNFITENSHAAWLLPQYLMRIIPTDNTYPIPTYGRHRYYAGGPLFAMGLGLVPIKFLPAIMWGFNQYWGMDGDQSLGINNTLAGIFVFVNYLENLNLQNPAEIFDRVLVDEKKGFYVFRNQWKGKDDFVASIYAKRELLPQSWSFPDGGSFRIWGLGGHWANPGKGEEKPENENIIILENSNKITMQPVYFKSDKDGSGIVSLQGETWLRSFAVDYSKVSGVPGLFVIVDKFNDEENNRTWVMNTEGYVTIKNNIFMIKSDKGTTMKGTFITPQQVNLTYQPEDQKIIATGKGYFWVVMTVQKENIPDLKIMGHGLNSQIIIGKRIITFNDNHLNFRLR
ncbi:hypothetical protein [Crocosphaera sp. XPORK-15E]|uniref:hypothetical protein n=1 Tax=Crocosphaera sp. XPORK-15E TaxID=3110247 RepID=UPI002B213BAA|nr:hypothetical protein [Crocosphaera sp. XPORK-15E]MEA5534820.1 hypothetical protein [Crocosphaera sp. XPORK-15E]